MIIDEILRKKDADIEHLTFKLQHAQLEIERLRKIEAEAVAVYFVLKSEAERLPLEITDYQKFVEPLRAVLNVDSPVPQRPRACA